VVDPVKIFPMKNLVTVSHTVRTHVEGREKYLARWYSGALGEEAWLTRRHTQVPDMTCRGRIWSLWIKLLVCNDEDHPEQFEPSRPALQGHSRSLELTPIDL